MRAVLRCAAGPVALGLTDCSISAQALNKEPRESGSRHVSILSRPHASLNQQLSTSLIRRPSCRQGSLFRASTLIGSRELQNKFVQGDLSFVYLSENVDSQQKHEIVGVRAAGDGSSGGRRSRTANRSSGAAGRTPGKKTTTGTRQARTAASVGVPGNGAFIFSAAVLLGGVIYLLQSGKLGFSIPKFEFKKPDFLEGPEATPEQKDKQYRKEAEQKLGMMMKEMQAVRTIDFNGKNLGDEGIAGLVTGFVYNTTVAEVNMASNGFTPEGVKFLVEGLRSTGTGCQIAKLNLDGNSFGDEGMALLGEFLQENSSIKTLTLNSCAIADEGCKALAEVLKRNTTITELELNNNMVDYEGCAALAEALANNNALKTLKLNGNYGGVLGGSALAKGVGLNSSLRELHLHGNNIGDEGMRILGEELLRREKDFKKVKMASLDLGNNSMTWKGAKEVATYIKKGKGVQWLNLYMNDFADKGAISLAEALAGNKTIATLDIGGNNIHEEGIGAIAEAIKENTSITTLELGYNPMGPDGAKELADTIKFFGNVETLRLGWCKLGVKGAEYFADALRYNATLSTLDLRANNIGDDGAALIARSLRVVNEKLEVLDLGFNEIRDQGAYALAEALKANGEAAVQVLNLTGNYITKYGQVALSEARDIVHEMNGGKEVNIAW